MEVVGSGFRGQQNRWSCARAVFGGIVVGQNLEFLNGVDGRKNGDTAGGQLVVVDAINQPVRAVRTRTADGKRERTARGNFAARCAGEEAVRVGFGRGTR